MVKRVDVVVFETIEQVVAHEFHGGLLAFGVKEEGIDYVHDGPHAAHIPAAVRKRVDSLKEQIVQGKITVPNH
jgi:basic membrane protein A